MKHTIAWLVFILPFIFSCQEVQEEPQSTLNETPTQTGNALPPLPETDIGFRLEIYESFQPPYVHKELKLSLIHI